MNLGKPWSVRLTEGLGVAAVCGSELDIREFANANSQPPLRSLLLSPRP